MYKIKSDYQRFKTSSSESPYSRKLGYLYGTIMSLCLTSSHLPSVLHCVQAAIDTLDPSNPHEKDIIERFKQAVKHHNITIEND